MRDPVQLRFLAETLGVAHAISRESHILRLVADPLSGDPPSRYHALLREVEHFERRPDGRPRLSNEPIAFTLHFPDSYLRSGDPKLQYQVLRVGSRVFHPNVRVGLVCLGHGFRPGTRLRPLVEQAYAVLSSRVYATQDALDGEARDYYRRHVEEVRRLRASPLWRHPVAGRVRVSDRAQPAAESRS